MARLVRATAASTGAAMGAFTRVLARPDNKPGHDEGKYVSLIAAWYYLSSLGLGASVVRIL
jgi:hypothetical protein